MKIHCLYDKLVSLKNLTPHPKNRNSHSKDQVERLAQILDYQGWRYPIKVSKKSGFITSGHGRLEAAKLKKWKEVPVNFQDYESDEQEYADVQSDNAIASWAELDLSGINSDLGELEPNFDINLLGIKDFVLEPADKLEPGCDEDEVPEKVEPKTRSGDLYQLGTHRLMCGDSTSIDAVEKLMNDEKADMVFTDPPYGMCLDTDYSTMIQKGGRTGNKFRPVIGDDQDFDPSIIFGLFEYCPEIFLWGADYYCQHLPKNGSWVVWDKRESEVTGSQVSEKMFGSMFELCWSKTKHKRDIARILWAGGLGQGISEERKGRNNSIDRCHPTQKPIMLAEWFFKRWGKDQDNIIDLFGGSGSTLIACEKTNRKCFMMEIDPHYCDVIVARWEKYTGKKAELIHGKN